MLGSIPEKHFEFKHLSLFFSACLRLETPTKPFTPVLTFVCEDIKLAHHDVRAMILSNILYFKLRQLSMLYFTAEKEALRRRKKLRAALFRQYAKVDLFRLTFIEFLSGLGVKGDLTVTEGARRLRSKAFSLLRHLCDSN